MSSFARHFDTRSLLEQLNNYPVLSTLLAEWQLPGADAVRTRHGLRLAVRAGYLNFYAKGQSVAKLSIVRGKPRLDVHHKYLGSEDGPLDRSGEYVALGGDRLAAIPATAIERWVPAALGYAGEEKRFVDDLVTANPGTIDLEMGLPGDPRVNKDGKMVAPRMDLVVLQDDGATLAFWEAKCADNGELRARSRQPHVTEQLRKYVDWLALPAADGQPDRGAEVLTAYRNAAQVLATLAQAAGHREGSAVALWRRAAEGLDAIRQPGVVVGNYWPSREGEDGAIRTTLLRAKADSFMKNQHLEALTGTSIDGSIRVEQYDAAPTASLPPLIGERIAR